jgi:hypothetical protein
MSRGSGSIHRADPNDSLTREPQTDRFLGRFERIGAFVDALVIGKFGNGHGAFDNARQEILSTVRAAIDRHRLPAAPLHELIARGDVVAIFSIHRSETNKHSKRANATQRRN